MRRRRRHDRDHGDSGASGSSLLSNSSAGQQEEPENALAIQLERIRSARGRMGRHVFVPVLAAMALAFLGILTDQPLVFPVLFFVGLLWLVGGLYQARRDDERTDREAVRLIAECRDPGQAGVLVDAYAVGPRPGVGDRLVAECLTEALARLLPQLSPEDAGGLGEKQLEKLRQIVWPSGGRARGGEQAMLRVAALEGLDRARDAGALPFARLATNPRGDAEVREAALRLLPNFEAYAASARMSATLVRPSSAPTSGELLRASAETDTSSAELLRATQGSGSELPNPASGCAATSDPTPLPESLVPLAREGDVHS